MQAVGYVRVSSEEQARSGVSLGAQRAQIRLYCKGRGWKLVGIWGDEGVSGVSLKRKGLRGALEVLEGRQASALVVTRLDRLSRSVRDIFALVEGTFAANGANLVSISENLDATTAMGRAFLGILAVLAQMERELGAERTRAALAHVRDDGRWLGAVAYGKRRGQGGRLVVDQEAVNAVRRAKKLRKKGSSWREVAELMGWTVSQTRTRVSQRYRNHGRRWPERRGRPALG